MFRGLSIPAYQAGASTLIVRPLAFGAVLRISLRIPSRLATFRWTHVQGPAPCATQRLVRLGKSPCVKKEEFGGWTRTSDPSAILANRL